MKKICTLVLCLIFTMALLCACSEDTTSPDSSSESSITVESPEQGVEPNEVATDYRNATWYMSKDEVKACEQETILVEDDTTLFCQSKVSTYSVSVMYTFSNNELIGGTYIFEDEHTNMNQYIDDFNNLKTLYTSVYGAPIIDDYVWKNDLYKDDPQYYGLAVSMGYLIYVAEWETESSDIRMMLWGDNYEIKLLANYTPIDYVPEKNTNGI